MHFNVINLVLANPLVVGLYNTVDMDIILVYFIFMSTLCASGCHFAFLKLCIGLGGIASRPIYNVYTPNLGGWHFLQKGPGPKFTKNWHQ